jgi:hypothetical protein
VPTVGVGLCVQAWPRRGTKGLGLAIGCEKRCIPLRLVVPERSVGCTIGGGGLSASDVALHPVKDVHLFREIGRISVVVGALIRTNRIINSSYI